MSIKPGRDVEPGTSTVLPRFRRIDLRRDERDLAAGDRDVAHRVDVVPCVDDVAAAQQQVVSSASACARPRLRAERRQGDGRGDGKERDRVSRQPLLRADRRLAVHVALRYSPMSSVPDMLVAGELAGEDVRQRVAAALRRWSCAAARRRRRSLPSRSRGDEVALMRAVDLALRAGAGAAHDAPTPAAYWICTSHAPERSAARCGGRLGVAAAGGFDSTACSRSATICLFAGRHHVGRDGDAGHAGSPPPAARRARCAVRRRGAPARRPRRRHRTSRDPSARAATASCSRAPRLHDLGRHAVDRLHLRGDVIEPAVQRFHSASWSRFTHISTAISMPMASSLPTL